MEFSQSPFGLFFLAESLINPTKNEVWIGVGWIELNRLLKFYERSPVLPLPFEQEPQLEVGTREPWVYSESFRENTLCLIEVAQLHQ